MAVDEDGDGIKNGHHGKGNEHFQEDVVVEDAFAQQPRKHHLDDADEVILQGKIGDAGHGDHSRKTALGVTVFNPLAHGNV